MNRPNKEDYLTRRMYHDAMENYCDKLEKAYHKLAKFISENIGMTDSNGKYESQEDWEEWAFKNERNKEMEDINE